MSTRARQQEEESARRKKEVGQYWSTEAPRMRLRWISLARMQAVASMIAIAVYASIWSVSASAP
jgi:hypothetical protein